MEVVVREEAVRVAVGGEDRAVETSSMEEEVVGGEMAAEPEGRGEIVKGEGGRGMSEGVTEIGVSVGWVGVGRGDVDEAGRAGADGAGTERASEEVKISCWPHQRNCSNRAL